jgi:hypothetical protein
MVYFRMFRYNVQYHTMYQKFIIYYFLMPITNHEVLTCKKSLHAHNSTQQLNKSIKNISSRLLQLKRNLQGGKIFPMPGIEPGPAG